MNMDLYNDTYDNFCSLVENKNADILEVGCGPGNIMKYLLSVRPDFNILGIDLADKMLELAKTNAPQADFKLLDARNIGTLSRKFDAILCGFCMPYLSKEESVELINNCTGLLYPGGILYLSTMEDDYNKSGYKTTSFSGQNRVYIYYHQMDYIEAALTNNGFEVKEVLRKDYPEPDGTTLTDLIIIAKRT